MNLEASVVTDGVLASLQSSVVGAAASTLLFDAPQVIDVFANALHSEDGSPPFFPLHVHVHGHVAAPHPLHSTASPLVQSDNLKLLNR